MQTEHIKQNLGKIEQCADEIQGAVKAASKVPDELRRCADTLHRQAREAKHQPLMDDALYGETVMTLEQLADEAMAMCRRAGDSLDAQVQQAVRHAHAELSNLKKEIRAHA